MKHILKDNFKSVEFWIKTFLLVVMFIAVYNKDWIQAIFWLFFVKINVWYSV